MQLSEHFYLSEFTKSQEGTRRGLDNTPPPEVVARLKALCENVLEQVRAHYGRPLVISSGYRSPAVNRAVKGSKTSQHCFGEAADFEIPGIHNIDVIEWMHRFLVYDQLIAEFVTRADPTAGWVHVSWKPDYRNQELTAKRVGGRTEYVPGIVV